MLVFAWYCSTSDYSCEDWKWSSVKWTLSEITQAQSGQWKFEVSLDLKGIFPCNGCIKRFLCVLAWIKYYIQYILNRPQQSFSALVCSAVIMCVVLLVSVFLLNLKNDALSWRTAMSSSDLICLHHYILRLVEAVKSLWPTASFVLSADIQECSLMMS